GVELAGIVGSQVEIDVGGSDVGRAAVKGEFPAIALREQRSDALAGDVKLERAMIGIPAQFDLFGLIDVGEREVLGRGVRIESDQTIGLAQLAAYHVQRITAVGIQVRVIAQRQEGAGGIDAKGAYDCKNDRAQAKGHH